MANTRHYELTDLEWEQVKDLLPLSKQEKKANLAKITETC
jgi:hypothetical protein